jgi:hypothetical protein
LWCILCWRNRDDVWDSTDGIISLKETFTEFVTNSYHIHHWWEINSHLSENQEFRNGHSSNKTNIWIISRILERISRENSIWIQ